MKIMIGAPRGTRRDTKSYIHTAESLRSRGFPIVIDEAQGGREGRSGGGERERDTLLSHLGLFANLDLR
jgi:hypothetical protein